MNPVSILFLLFLAVPMVEIYFLIKVGNQIGAISTIALVVFTAVFGAMLLRFQGLATLQKTQQAMSQGQIPAIEMMEGVLLVFSGALLLTPGFVTDAVGFTLLVPPIRQALVHWFVRRSAAGSQFFNASNQSNDSRPPPTHEPHIIEGECRREDD